MRAKLISQSPAADARLQPAAVAPEIPAARRHRFEILYRNSQGTLMRLLTTVSRRGLDFEAVHAEPDPHAPGLHRLALIVRANEKHIAQMCRDWRVTTDVAEVRQPLDLEREPEGAIPAV